MKVLTICAVILLTSTQLSRASPAESSEVVVGEILDGSLNSEDLSDLRQEINQAILSFSNNNDEDEQQSVDEVENDEDDANEGEEVNGYDGEDDSDDGEDDDDDDDGAMDLDMMEKTLGIEIPICAQYAELTYPLHLSHLSECNKFYKCSNGRAFLFDCPGSQHWSVKLDRCDYPELAGCTMNGMHQYKLRKASVKPASDTGNVSSGEDAANEVNGSNPESEFEVDPRCDGGDPFKPLHFAHPRDCTKFYKCYMGKAYVIKCPRGQHWGQRLNRCEHPTLARCTALKPAASAVAASLAVAYMDIPEEKHTILDDADYVIRDERCVNDPGDRFRPTHFAHPSDCQMFYKCFNRLAYKVSCPAGLHYNVKTKACDYPEMAQCATVGIQSAQHNIELSSLPDCSHGRTVTYGIQGSISRFFQCQGGEAYLRECNADEFFNVNIMHCDKMPYDPHYNQHNDRVRRPQWPQMTPFMSNYPNNYYQPMWWGMNSHYPNYNNWQQPIKYPAPYPHVPLDEHKVPTQPVDRTPQLEEEKSKIPDATLHIPQVPYPGSPSHHQQQQKPDFPSWLPQLNTNIALPQFPPAKSEKHEPESENNSDFDFMRGSLSALCPQVDDPENPVHLTHETSCTKFYKCFQQRAFLMECPNEQEWSDELQRCDYPTISHCDPSELIKRKVNKN